MVLSHQQKQTKKFFDRNATQWSKAVNKKSKYWVNVIDQRNKYVEKICNNHLQKNAKILDVGCGTGELVLDLVKRGFDAHGIDFADSMIKKAQEKCLTLGIQPQRFLSSSFFDFSPITKYKLISANGFIEYISEKDLEVFIKKTHNLLTEKGFFVLGSRNRLFNIFSFNDYTKTEIKDKNAIPLLKECLVFNSVKSLKDLLKIDFIQKASQNPKKHAYTGIEVTNRNQYTPFQLFHKLTRAGFQIVDLAPMNIHVLTTGAKKIEKHARMHDYISNYFQDKKDIGMQVIPQSSTFMITARKI